VRPKTLPPIHNELSRERNPVNQTFLGYPYQIWEVYTLPVLFGTMVHFTGLGNNAEEILRAGRLF
jgi:hypothetical protein